MLKIRPHIKYFHSSQNINDLANGEICVAMGWSGDMLIARDRAAEAGQAVEIAYTIPEEGAVMWFDNLAVPSDAPHPENAHLFLDYIMEPEVAAAISNYVFYANANPGLSGARRCGGEGGPGHLSIGCGQGEPLPGSRRFAQVHPPADTSVDAGEDRPVKTRPLPAAAA